MTIKTLDISPKYFTLTWLWASLTLHVHFVFCVSDASILDSPRLPWSASETIDALDIPPKSQPNLSSSFAQWLVFYLCSVKPAVSPCLTSHSPFLPTPNCPPCSFISEPIIFSLITTLPSSALYCEELASWHHPENSLSIYITLPSSLLSNPTPMHTPLTANASTLFSSLITVTTWLHKPFNTSTHTHSNIRLKKHS